MHSRASVSTVSGQLLLAVTSAGVLCLFKPRGRGDGEAGLLQCHIRIVHARRQSFIFLPDALFTIQHGFCCKDLSLDSCIHVPKHMLTLTDKTRRLL